MAVTTSYNTLGYPTTLAGTSSYLAATLYTGEARVDTRLIGSTPNQVTRKYTYSDVAKRLSNITTTNPAGTPAIVENDSFSYDAESNVTSVNDGTTGQRECFKYDGLNRLVDAYTILNPLTCATTADSDYAGTLPYRRLYGYDTIGNMLTARSYIGPLTYTTRTFTMGGASGGPHAVTAATNPAATYSYDSNGAMQNRPAGGNLTWDELHQLDTAGTTTFRYDADGNRLVRKTATETTLYLDGMEIRATTSGTVTGATRYYGNLALRRTDGADAGLWWQLANQQNSAGLAFKDGTAVVRHQRYLPYGEHRDATLALPVDRGFLNKTEDPTGLNAVGARYYDPTLGRFVSVDPLVAPAEPSTLNPYSYALDNPTSLTDPTGLAVTECDGTCDSNAGNGGTAPSTGAPISSTPGRPDERLDQTIGLATLGSERDDSATVDDIAKVRSGGFSYSQLNPREQRDTLAMTWCYNNPSSCRQWDRDQWKAFHRSVGNFLLEATGINDARRCLQGSKAGCAWTASAIVPLVGKAAKFGRLAEVSAESLQAAHQIGNWTVKAKHLATAGGRWAKFAHGLDEAAVRGIVQEALMSRGALFLPNMGGSPTSFLVVADVGRVIGSQGQTAIRVVIDQGRVITAFPVK